MSCNRRYSDAFGTSRSEAAGEAHIDVDLSRVVVGRQVTEKSRRVSVDHRQLKRDLFAGKR